MLGVKYHINPETLRYEPIKLSSAQKVRRISLMALAVLSVAVLMRVGFERNFPSPRQLAYQQHNQELRASIARDADLQLTEERLKELSERDDNCYRSILSLQPLPSTMREAGIGGAEMNTHLSMLRDPEQIKDLSQKLVQVQARAQIQNSSLNDIYREAVEHQHFLACRPSINPIAPADPFWYTSMFGRRRDPFTGKRTDHHGVDLAGPEGTNIHCTGEGRVTLVRKSRFGYGNEVRIDHGYGFTSIYAHLHDIHVKRGDTLERGAIVGTMGNTGRSTGPHLHYEIRYNGKPLDPMDHFVNDLSTKEYQILVDRAMASR